jgi:hypothetical protein
MRGRQGRRAATATPADVRGVRLALSDFMRAPRLASLVASAFSGSLGVASLGLAVFVGGTVAQSTAQDQCVVVDDFSKAPVGEFPVGWKARKDVANGVYQVAEDGGKRFVRADAKDVGVQAGKQFEWNVKEYPVLAWSWRPQEFPKGADERTTKNDSALAVYAVFPHTPVSVKSVKYIWSEKVPKGTHIPQTGGNTQGVVLRTNGGVGGDWVEERVNVAQDYKRYFKTDEVPKPEGIAVLTDSDDTSSRARGDYARFRVCRG